MMIETASSRAPSPLASGVPSLRRNVPPSSGLRALAAKGFRPFFLLAGVSAIALVPVWLLMLTGGLRPAHFSGPTWHAHEMIFGFVMAVVSGFLLTAVSNWTGRETASGAPLLALAGLWLAGRVVLAASASLPSPLVALVDLAFVPALMLVLARPLLAAGNRRNYVMLGILLLFFSANLCMHFEALGLLGAGAARRASLVSVDLVLVLITVIAGRIFPTFTRNATGVATITSVPWLDALAVAAIIAVTLVDAVAPASRTSLLLPGVAGVVMASRAVPWGMRHSFKQPLVWILHTGHAWLALGLVLRAVPSGAGMSVAALATHALTVGAIGSLTLGMMARVGLGHSGRMLVASPAIAAAFVAINLAAVVRVFLPLLVPSWYLQTLVLAGVFWVLAFSAFTVVYAPILWSPRVDGKPG
jgi:uncharacterized protein involved in response to NO